jgi:hypothetical protein
MCHAFKLFFSSVLPGHFKIEYAEADCIYLLNAPATASPPIPDPHPSPFFLFLDVPATYIHKTLKIHVFFHNVSVYNAVYVDILHVVLKFCERFSKHLQNSSQNLLKRSQISKQHAKCLNSLLNKSYIQIVTTMYIL